MDRCCGGGIFSGIAREKKRRKEIRGNVRQRGTSAGGVGGGGGKRETLLAQGGRGELRAGTRGERNGRVKRAAARRNSSLALIALGGLLSIMSGNRWLTQFPTARFVWPA